MKLFFTFPKLINGKYWDFHYHFGLDTTKFKDKVTKIPIDVIYFHKTRQDANRKFSDNCFFRDNLLITNVEDIHCVQTVLNKMTRFFPPDGEDFKYIEEIISRPFLGIRLGGAKRRTRRTRKHVRKHCHNRSRSAKLRRL